MSHKSIGNQPWENTIKVDGLWCSIVVHHGHNTKDVVYYPAGHYDYSVRLPGCVSESQVVRYIKRVHKL